MSTGTVEWYNPMKGVGRIKADTPGSELPEKLFIHFTTVAAVEKVGDLSPGQAVSFDRVVDHRGRACAENILKVSPSP
jgi:cold shock CspA family protein